MSDSGWKELNELNNGSDVEELQEWRIFSSFVRKKYSKMTGGDVMSGAPEYVRNFIETLFKKLEEAEEKQQKLVNRNEDLIDLINAQRTSIADLAFALEKAMDVINE